MFFNLLFSLNFFALRAKKKVKLLRYVTNK